MTPGMVGICSTAMDEADVDPYCQTLMQGIRSLREKTSHAA